MYFNSKGFAAAVLFVSMSTQAQQATESDVEMIAQPNKCVALTQGRRCYAQVSISWTSNSENDVCLVDLDKQLELYCWRSKTQGRYLYEMASSTDINLALVRKTDAILSSQNPQLASTTLKVSWLYEGNTRKRRWRLF